MSEGAALTAKWDMFSLKFCWLLTSLNMFRNGLFTPNQTVCISHVIYSYVYVYIIPSTGIFTVISVILQTSPLLTCHVSELLFHVRHDWNISLICYRKYYSSVLFEKHHVKNIIHQQFLSRWTLVFSINFIISTTTAQALHSTIPLMITRP